MAVARIGQGHPSNDDDQPFTGVFDGGGRTVANLEIALAGHNLGLFESNAGRITDLVLRNPRVDSGPSGNTAAPLAAHNLGLIEYCRVEGGSADGFAQIGGLVGQNHGGGLVVGCFSSCRVTAEADPDRTVRTAGGLVAFNSGRVIACVSAAEVSGRATAGGLAGYNTGPISYSYAAGSVSGGRTVGGLIGENGARLRHCYSSARVLTEVSGSTSAAGGLVGLENRWSVIEGGFWDVDTSGVDATEGAAGTGLGTAALQEVATFVAAGWELAGGINGPSEFWIVDPAVSNSAGAGRQSNRPTQEIDDDLQVVIIQIVE